MEPREPSSLPSQSNSMEKTIQPNIHDASDVQVASPANDQAATEDENKHLTGIKLYTLFLALTLITLMMSLDASILATAIPRVTDDFHTIANIGWYGAAYMVGNACLQPLTGKVYSNFPLKLSFFAFVAWFEFGSILCAAATSSTMLVIGRAVAGMGGSGLVNGSLTLVGVAAPPSQRPTVVGIIMSMFGVGQIIGPLVGGALTQHASWRWCFWINLPIGAASVAGVLAVRLPPQDDKPKITRHNFLQFFDLIGFALFAPATIMLLLALQWGGIEYAWSSATIIGLFCGSAATYVIFIAWEIRAGDHAMFPRSLLRQWVITCSVLASFFFGGALLTLAYYLPLWFQVIKQVSPTSSAVHTLPTFISQIISTIAAGPVVGIIGFFSPLSMVGAIISAIGNGLMTTFNPTTSVGKLIGYQILTGVGRGMSFQQPINAVQAAAPKKQLSTGMAIVMWSQFFGAAIMLGLAQLTFTELLKSGLKKFAPDVNPATVINAGATNYQLLIPPSEQAGVLLAYNEAITRTFLLPTVLTAAAAVVTLGMGWKRVIPRKEKTPKRKGEKEVKQDAATAKS